MFNLARGHARARLLIIPACLAFTSLTAITLASNAYAQIGIDITATVAPPPLVEYEQPPLPAPGYIWTPGYWLYGDAGYYWVPGTWVEPPSVGLLWTPGYWGFIGGRYTFNAGYWGPHVGFYGGINYGFGYGGEGYEGGFWRGGAFSYNSAVNNFGGVHVTNVYRKTVVNDITVNRVSFNGPGGIDRRPTPAEQTYAHETHVQPTAAQVQHREVAARTPELRDSVNHGHPAITATSRPGDLSTSGRTPAGHATAARTEETRPAEARSHEASDHEARSHEASGHEAGDHEARSHEASGREAGDHEAGNHEAGNHEAGNHETTEPRTERPASAAAAPARSAAEHRMAAPSREPGATHARMPEHEPEPRAEPPHAEIPHATQHAAAAPRAEHAVAPRGRPAAAPAAMRRPEPAHPAHAHPEAGHDDKGKR